MLWDQLTSTEFARIDRGVPVLLAVAATEQHGPHLPLATDRMIADHFSREIDKALGGCVLCLPTQALGCSEHHMDFAGTLSLRHESFRLCVLDTLESCARHGFRNFFILNAHGGNQAINGVILEQFGSAHPETRIATASWWQVARETLGQLTQTGPGGVGHACEFETSLMLSIAPDLVRQNAIPARANVATYDWAEGDMLRGARASLFRSTRQMTPTGVFGEPSAANTETGTAITTAVVAALASILTSLFGIM